jgi:PAS domain S-box-containing protein
MKTLLLAQAVADHISAMIAYWDKDLVCRFANAPYLNWFGKTSSEMIDKITISELLGPLYEKSLPYIQGVLKGEPQTFEREIPLPSGGTRHTLANYFPDIIDGKVIGFYAHVADINELKLLQKDLSKYNEVINQQNKWLANFANVVAHDLRAYAGNLSSLLELHEITADDDEKGVIIDYIKDLSKGFTSTVENLSKAAQIQNMDKQEYEPCNLLNYVVTSKKTLYLQITSFNAIVTININPDLLVLAQPAYLGSIVLNLMSNALKYHHPDRRPVVTISSAIEKDKVLFEVKDNGIGIDLHKHGKELFGLFKTFNGNVDAKGIGLYITRFQVEAMGGNIDVESTMGEGTCFKIFLNPAKDPPQPAPAV